MRKKNFKPEDVKDDSQFIVSLPIGRKTFAFGADVGNSYRLMSEQSGEFVLDYTDTSKWDETIRNFRIILINSHEPEYDHKLQESVGQLSAIFNQIMNSFGGPPHDR